MAKYGPLSFNEQIQFFRRKLNLSTAAWTEIWQEAHDHAFVVAGANRDELVADFRAAVDKAIAEGTTLEEFRRDFDAIVSKHGWSYNGSRGWRSKVIYETNLRTSYAAGRYAQLKANVRAFPYWKYNHSHIDKVPRVFHITPAPEGLNGMVAAHDDPIWDVYFPPNGWGCTCYVTGTTEPGDNPPPAVIWETQTVGVNGPSPRTVQVARGTDPGFSYAPGQSAWLKQEAQRAVDIADAQASAYWQPQSVSTAQDLGRADLQPEPAPTIEPTAKPDDAVKVSTDHDVPAIIDTQAARIDPHQMPLITDTLANPAEIWALLEKDPNSGSYRIRLSVVKRLEVNGQSMLAIAEIQDETLVGWRLIPYSAAAADHVRRGTLFWSD